jgi:ubiquinone/menaquinone biosynthesis C-methylase UbiE
MTKQARSKNIAISLGRKVIPVRIRVWLREHGIRSAEYHPVSYWREEMGGPEQWSLTMQHSPLAEDTKKNIKEIVIPMMSELHHSGGRVLDAGCGPGFHSYAFAESGLWDSVFGVDFEEHRIEFARKNYRHPKITYSLGQLQELTFPDEFFDTIWTGSVLCHIPTEDKIRVVNEFRRVLKPSGFYLGAEAILPGSGVRSNESGHMTYATVDWFKRHFSPFTVDLISSEEMKSGRYHFPTFLLYAHR